jgi:integrase
MSAYRRGRRWWITYTVRGERVREPGGFDGRGARTKSEAEEKLKSRIGELHADRYIGPEADRLTVTDILDAYENDLSTREKKGRSKVRIQLVPVRRHFGTWRAVDVKRADLDTYIAKMRNTHSARGTPFAPATINRGLHALRAAYRLALKSERLGRVPFVPSLREDNARKGFFERADFEAVVAHLTGVQAAVARFAYLTGWRRSEILGLPWADVDLDGGFVSVFDTKNGEARSLPLDADLRAVLDERKAARSYERRDGTAAVSAFVFHRRGFRLQKLDGWKAACVAAACPGKLLHDFRRTAARDMIRAGVPQAVAMKRTGHKTDSMFRRYNIVSGADLLDAAERTAAYRASRPAASNVVALGHNLGTVSARPEN